MKKGDNGNRARIDHDVGVFRDFEITRRNVSSGKDGQDKYTGEEF